MKVADRGKLVIISGPSGAGKSSVVRALLEICPLPLALSVSATTRPPRRGERDGVDYHFLTQEDFRRRRSQGEFLECKEVYGRGDWYGTLKSTVSAALQEGKWLVLPIDVEGAAAVLEQYPEAITIFLHAGSLEELERRLRQRGTESEASLQSRLAVARRELAMADRYRHQVVNHTISLAAREICDVLRAYAVPA